MSDETINRLGIEIRGVYDGVSVWVSRENGFENRWDGTELEGSGRWKAAEEWIAAANLDYWLQFV